MTIRERRPLAATRTTALLSVIITVSLTVSGVLVTPLAAVAATAVQVGIARVDDLVNPVGIDDTTPVFSWTLTSSTSGTGQSAYEIRAASSQALLSGGSPDLWATGKVASGAFSASYAGKALTSRTTILWQIRAWDQAGTVSEWSTIQSAEIGLLSQSDWSAKWIADSQTLGNPVTVTFPVVQARYVRLDVSTLGLPVAGNATQYFMQLAELQVKNGAAGANLASAGTFTASGSFENSGWKVAYLNDGVTDTNNASAHGWTSWPASTSPSPSAPIWVQVDLGSVVTVDRIVLYPRTDTLSDAGTTASFPTDFTVSTASSSPSGNPAASVVASATDVPAPAYTTAGAAFPIVPAQATTARYVTLAVPSVSVPESASRNFAQFAEVQVLDAAGVNLAAGRPVQVSSDFRSWGWAKENLVDGVTDTNNGSARGWTTDPVSYTPTLPNVAIVTIDLGADKAVDRVVLWPRTDVSNNGNTMSFPSSYTLRAIRASGYTLATTVVGQIAPPPPAAVTLPILARDFTPTPGKTVVKARLYVSGLGIYQASINGAKIGDDVLAPGYSDWSKKVEYATYDVTTKLVSGNNAVGLALGTGNAYISNSPGRYAKYTTDISRPKAIAQLEITYSDGTRSTVGTDSSWRVTTGPWKLSNWYGGEDFDATKQVTGWDQPGTDRSSWRTPVTPPGTPPQLIAPLAPALRVVDTLPAAQPTAPAAGVSVYKFPVNFAGWEQVTFTAPAGTTLQFWPGEKLDGNGRVNQTDTGTPVYDSVVSNGSAITWHPTFRYNGLQYLEIRGITSSTTISAVQGLVIRAANDQVGSFTSSNSTLNSVHTLIDRAIQSNMYSTLTDCPTREKLGWLEETHLVFGSVMRNYDVGAYARSIVKKIADSQLSNGLVPSTAPEYVVLNGGLRDDPNWGAALILMPWAMYLNYGDTQTLAKYYTQMQAYLAYLDTHRSTNTAYSNTLQYDQGLGDWAEQGVNTDKNLAATFGYYRAVFAMAGIAKALGKTNDASSYSAEAARISSDAQSRWYDPTNKTVSNSTQGAMAFALDMNAVPTADRTAIAAKLAASITSNSKHLTVGEIALPSLYRVLAKYGYDQIIFDATTQTTAPSYGYFVSRGAGSLPEYWNMAGSLNHFMLGAVDEWLSTSVAGISQADDSIAFKSLIIKPSVVGGLTNAQAGYRTKNGAVSSAWSVASGKLKLTITVPVGSTARIEVPLLANPASSIPMHAAGATYVGAKTLVDGNYAEFTVGSGTWIFGPDFQ